MTYDKLKEASLFSSMNENSINELVKSNRGLVFKQLKTFGLHKDNDAISLAMEALYIAIVTFDTSKKFQLSSYATVCIYNKLGSYVRSIKSKIDTVSYDTPIFDDKKYLDVLHSTDTADGRYLEYTSVINIYRVVITEINKTTKTLPRQILDIWYEANFKITNREIAIKVKCSQPYVNKVLNNFRNKIIHKVR